MIIKTPPSSTVFKTTPPRIPQTTFLFEKYLKMGNILPPSPILFHLLHPQNLRPLAFFHLSTYECGSTFLFCTCVLKNAVSALSENPPPPASSSFSPLGAISSTGRADTELISAVALAPNAPWRTTTRPSTSMEEAEEDTMDLAMDSSASGICGVFVQ